MPSEFSERTASTRRRCIDAQFSHAAKFPAALADNQEASPTADNPAAKIYSISSMDRDDGSFEADRHASRQFAHV